MKNSFKKVFALVMMVVLAVTALFVFVGCNDKNADDEIPAVTGITAKVASDANYTVGKAFDSSYITVTASLDDKTTKAIATTAAISYDLTALKLDKDGNFTEAGSFELTVKYSDFSTTVTVKVNSAA